MRVTNTFRMADGLVGGRLAEVITEYRDQNLAWEDIARRLYADYGVQVTASTIRRWSELLDQDAATA